MNNFFSIMIGVTLLYFATSAMLVAQEKSDFVIFNGEVLNIEDTGGIDEGTADAYHFVDYEVLKVCHGEIDVNWLRVEHIVGTAKDLQAGDMVCRRVRRTDKFRKYREILFDAGLDPVDAFISDYEFWGYNVPCQCE